MTTPAKKWRTKGRNPWFSVQDGSVRHVEERKDMPNETTSASIVDALLEFLKQLLDLIVEQPWAFMGFLVAVLRLVLERVRNRKGKK